MNAELLLREFERVAYGPDAFNRLRRFVLDLAVRGQLVEPSANGRNPVTRNAPLPWTIPDSWNVITVADLAGSGGVFVDGDWVESKDQDPNGDVRLIQLADVGVGRFRNRSARFMRSDVAERLHCTYLEPGDILIARMPDPIGRACIFPGDTTPCVTVVDVALIRSNRPDVAGNYLVHALNSSLFVEMVKQKAAGTTRQRISRGNLGKLPFPLPPVPEQSRIVAKVDELLALCDQWEKAQKERETRRDALRAATLDRLRGSDGEAKLSDADVRFFLDMSPRLITKPEHVAALRETILYLAVQGRLVSRDPRNPWRQTTLGALGKWGSGGTPDSGRADFYGGDIPWIVIGDLNESVVTETASTLTELGLQSSSAKMVEAGAVLIAMYGASVGKLGIASMPCATNQAIAHCVPDSSVVERDYLWLCLRGLRKALIASGRGGAQPNISQSILKAWPVLLPALAEQRRIVVKVDQLLALCDQLEAALAATQDGRSRLLEALLHEALGRAAVPNPIGTETAV